MPQAAPIAPESRRVVGPKLMCLLDLGESGMALTRRAGSNWGQYYEPNHLLGADRCYRWPQAAAYAETARD